MDVTNILEKIFDDRSHFDGLFIDFYESLQHELSQVTDEEINEKIDILKYWFPKEAWEKMGELPTN